MTFYLNDKQHTELITDLIIYYKYINLAYAVYRARAQATLGTYNVYFRSPLSSRTSYAAGRRRRHLHTAHYARAYVFIR